MIFDFDKGYDDQPIIDGDYRPLIAISANIIEDNTALAAPYSEAIQRAGALPVVVPHNSTPASLRELVRRVDGVLFSGGADFDARYFGDENIEGLTQFDSSRDYLEFALLRAALDCGLPVMGICRGCQLFNIALGGTLYQDLPSQYGAPLLKHSILVDKHLGVHHIEISKDSLLAKILETNQISVNSRHHQALKSIASSLRVVATSPDGVVEAVEGYPNLKLIGVQWHPENMATQGNSDEMKRLFAFFVNEARLYNQATSLHTHYPIVDSHCDTPMLYDEGGFDLALRNRTAKVDISRMEEGALDCAITVAYIPQSTPINSANRYATDTLNRFVKDIEFHSNRVVIARDIKQLLSAKKAGLRSIMLAIENGLALGEDISSLDRFGELGIVYLTLCHNGANQICDSAIGEPIYGGLSPFGRKVIEKLNTLGITIDVSHSSHATTIEAIELSQQPVIASHSSCKSLCNHPRNLSDEAICAIAAGGGVVQVCGYEYFLKEDGGATLQDIVAHIEHIVSLVGYDYAGIGSDFDGGGGVVGFDGANHFKNLTIELLRRGHSNENISKIMGGNIVRVLQGNLQKADSKPE